MSELDAGSLADTTGPEQRYAASHHANIGAATGAAAVSNVYERSLAGAWWFKDRYGLPVLLILASITWWFYNRTPVHTPPAPKTQADWDLGRLKALEKRQALLQKGASDAADAMRASKESELQKQDARRAERYKSEMKRMKRLKSVPKPLTVAALRRDPAANRIGRPD